MTSLLLAVLRFTLFCRRGALWWKPIGAPLLDGAYNVNAAFGAQENHGIRFAAEPDTWTFAAAGTWPMKSASMTRLVMLRKSNTTTLFHAVWLYSLDLEERNKKRGLSR